MFLGSAWLLAWTWHCVVPAVDADLAEFCEDTSRHQRHDITHAVLMQRKKEQHVVAPSEWHGSQDPRAVRLLLSEMEGLADRRGVDGLDPEEMEHIKTIKGLIAETIIPSILDGAEESRQEISELYEAILNCTGRATGELQSESTLHEDVKHHRDDHKECRELEDDIIEERDRVCKQFNLNSASMQLPAGGMPGLEADDATMIQYLKTMDEYFCGRMDTFKDEWDACEDLKDNYTLTNSRCVGLQQDFEETWCLWLTELEGTCDGLSACWNSSMARFHERKTAIEKLVEDRKEALQGAMKVQCLWDAWEWDREPCTVNKTKVKECKDLEPNTSAIEVHIPSPPPPLPCDTSEAGYFPCTDAFVGNEYSSLDVSQGLIDEMRAACSACPPSTSPTEVRLTLEPIHNLYLAKIERVPGSTNTYRRIHPIFTGFISCQTHIVFKVSWALHTVEGSASTLYIRTPSDEQRLVSVRQGTLDMGPDWDFLVPRSSIKVGDGDVITADWTGEKIKVTLGDVLVAEGVNIFSEGARAFVDLGGAARAMDVSFWRRSSSEINDFD